MSNKICVTIRPAEVTDLDPIVAIEQAAFYPEEASSKQALKSHIITNHETFLVAEVSAEVAGYMDGVPIKGRFVTDDLFHGSGPEPQEGGWLAITSLAIAEAYQGQGIGTALIAAMKDLALAQGRQGITLTCHDYLISYYEKQGFSHQGLSDSTHGGAVWHNLSWWCP